jgi:hypothetical protein
MRLGILKEEEIKELTPHEIPILLTWAKLNIFRQLVMSFIAKSLHKLWVFRKLFDQISLRDIRLALELWIIVRRFSLDSIENPLEQKECHLVLSTDTKVAERINLSALFDLILE